MLVGCSHNIVSVLDLVFPSLVPPKQAQLLICQALWKSVDDIDGIRLVFSVVRFLEDNISSSPVY